MPHAVSTRAAIEPTPVAEWGLPWTRPRPAPGSSPRWSLPANLRAAVGPLLFATVFVVYLALSQFVVWLHDPVDNAGASLWPAAGLSLGALLLVPTRRWPWVLGAVASAELSGNVLLQGYPFAASMGWTLANCVEPLLGAALLRLAGNRHGALAPVRQLLLFIGLAVVIAPAVGAVIGTTASTLGSPAAFGDVLPKYFVGDALGVLIVAPLLLTWRAARMRRSATETLALSAASVTLAVLIFSHHGRSTATMAYLLIPFFTWAALRYGVRGVSWLSLVVTMIGNWFTAVGEGPFTGMAAAGQAVTLLQMFLAISVATAFVLAAIVSQLSDRTQLETALRHQASHDTLTGLPNRAFLAETLEEALASRSANPSRVALLMCDIDHLKVVNDTMGHPAGDELIGTIARRLRGSIRPDDVVARISGDEFVVVLEDVSRADAVAMSARIMADIARPVPLTDHRALTPSLSIGVAMGESGSSGESVFIGADAALYEAKKLGRGRTVLFDDALRERVREELQIEVDLPAALGDGQIFCLHQPEIVIATGALFGFESLARWNHPQRGLISADKFIPAVDATGSSGRLFGQILQQTLLAQQHWAKILGFHPCVAVNLSAIQLSDPRLTESVALALARADAPAGSLWLELTETGLAERSALSSLTSLHDLGVHLALDDFGTGWSSMSRLAQYPWDMLKIDRAFVASLGVDPRAEHLVRAMIVMAHALGMTTVGEGIETPDQLARLTDLGCDIAQGFLFSRAVSAREAVDMVDATGHWTGHPTVAEPAVWFPSL